MSRLSSTTIFSGWLTNIHASPKCQLVQESLTKRKGESVWRKSDESR